MKNQIQLANTADLVAHSRPFFRLLFRTLLGCSLAVSSVARAVTLPPDGGHQEQNIAEGEDALSSLTTGADNTTIGFDALYSNTVGSDNAQASWIWTATGRLVTPREGGHTATLLPNGMVLVAGGKADNHILSASAELGHRQR